MTPSRQTDALPKSVVTRRGTRDFADVARRISRFVANLVATAVVVLLAVVVGRELAVNWRAGTAPTATGTSTATRQTVGAPGDGSQSAPMPGEPLITLRFGESRLQMRRMAVYGSREAARAGLREMCRRALGRPGQPVVDLKGTEAELLALLDRKPPVERLGQQGEIFEAAGSLTMAVGVRPAADAAAERASGDGTPQPRVLTWGLAIPTGRDEWAAYAFDVPTTEHHALEKRAMADRSVPLPPGARHVMSIDEAGQQGISVVRGPGNADEWKRHYDDWFQHAGFAISGPWSHVGQQWQARYTHRASDRTETVHVHVSPDRPGVLRSVLTRGSEPATHP